MADDLGEKTEEATPRRRQQAREEGNVARSQDLGGALMLVVMTLALWAAAAWMLGEARTLLAHALDDDVVTEPLSLHGASDLAFYLGGHAIRIIAPILLVAWVVGALGQLLQVGWMFSPTVLQPKLSKLNPTSGVKRIFGTNGLVKAGMDTLKVVIVLAVAAVTIYQYSRTIVLLPQLEMLQAVVKIAGFLLDLALRVAAVLLLLAVLDYFYQRWKHSKDMRMTKQEVQDEMKQMDGDPQVKRRRMRMQQQLTMQRIGAAVPQADVVVTNPQHLAVAIKYDADRMNAPRVIAKGADLLAMRIRQIALRHGIPVVERKPLARALYREVEVNQEIPPQFYQAVAEILAYVYRMAG